MLRVGQGRGGGGCKLNPTLSKPDFTFNDFGRLRHPYLLVVRHLLPSP